MANLNSFAIFDAKSAHFTGLFSQQMTSRSVFEPSTFKGLRWQDVANGRIDPLSVFPEMANRRRAIHAPEREMKIIWPPRGIGSIVEARRDTLSPRNVRAFDSAFAFLKLSQMQSENQPEN